MKKAMIYFGMVMAFMSVVIPAHFGGWTGHIVAFAVALFWALIGFKEFLADYVDNASVFGNIAHAESNGVIKSGDIITGVKSETK